MCLNSLESERKLDPQRPGVAAVVDLDTIEGREASVASRKQRPAGGYPT